LYFWALVVVSRIDGKLYSYKLKKIKKMGKIEKPVQSAKKLKTLQ